jgi:hypothetical protein
MVQKIVLNCGCVIEYAQYLGGYWYMADGCKLHNELRESEKGRNEPTAP